MHKNEKWVLFPYRRLLWTRPATFFKRLFAASLTLVEIGKALTIPPLVFPAGRGEE